MSKIIGIDLGTSNSAAAVMEGGKPVIIPSAEGTTLGGKAFPSYVAITKDGRELVASGGSSSGIGDNSGVRVESFEFEIPLNQVAKFRIGTRPIRMVEWTNVMLPP